jgi:alanyl-tRNA synthetase
MTEKLFERDGMLRSFCATVLSVTPTEDRYAVVLDRTAFFPEGGGQTADTGRIGDARVLDMQTVHGDILHYTDAPLAVGETYDCALDFDLRFRKMQNHLGEHLLCGAIHTLYGYDNVGFHLGADYMTFDVNGQMTEEEIRAAEELANRAVAADAPVRCYVPEDPSSLVYRAKSERLEAESAIRIVEVEGFDRCACCAPHLDTAGKVGIIKIVDAMHYKGGMRFWAFCGLDALLDYDRRLSELRRAARLLSAKPENVADAIEARLAELSEAKATIGALKRERLTYKIAAIAPSKDSICCFDSTLDAGELRNLANEGVKKTEKIFAAFSGNDAAGYQFVLAARNLPLKEMIPTLQATLGGRCGGSDSMLFGQATAKEDDIRRCIDRLA